MNKIYIIATSYQAAREFCANQSPEINPRGKNVRILLRPEAAHGVRLDHNDRVYKVLRPGDNMQQYEQTLRAWKVVELTFESRE